MNVLITGASSGIGKDMATVLAKKGHNLVLCARRLNRLEEIKTTLEQEYKVKVHCIPADLSKAEECCRLHKETEGMDIDILINNAGFGICGTFDQTDLDVELQMVDIDIKAVHILTKLFLKDFIKKDKGQILNTASIAGFMPGPRMATYYAAKNYVVRLTQAIYEELRQEKSNVKISMLCPGPVKTEFNKVANVKFSVEGLDSYKVAEYTIKKLEQGKLLIIPGTMMKLAKFAERFISDKFMLKISYHMQKRKLR